MKKPITPSRHFAETKLGLAILEFYRQYGEADTKAFINGFELPRDNGVQPISLSQYRDGKDEHYARIDAERTAEDEQ